MKSKNRKRLEGLDRGSGGRPRLKDADKRSHRIGVPLNSEELMIITERAAKHRMKNAAFLRHIGLGRKLPRPVPAINFRAYRRLGRMGAGINQLLRMSQEKRFALTSRLAQQILDELLGVRRLLITGEGDEPCNDDRQ